VVSLEGDADLRVRLMELGFCPETHVRVVRRAPFGAEVDPARDPVVRTIALLGNPNVGKTSLFNHLTGLRQKVGNFPGVTVERREGRLVGTPECLILDLPGVNSLVPRAPDEEVAAAVLTGAQEGVPRPDGVVVVVDAARPRRGLFLLSQAMELGLPTLVCLNMVDEARKSGGLLDADVLADRCGVRVVETVGSRRNGAAPLASALRDHGFTVADVEKLASLPGIQGLPTPSLTRWTRLREVVSTADLGDQEVAGRYAWVRDRLDAAQPAAEPRERSDRLDKILLHPMAGPVVFVLVMGTLFQAVFALADAPIEWIETGVGAMGDVVTGWLPTGLFADFLVNGVIAGVGGVLVFLPQILILFFFIGILEDSGYMTRAAFLVDRPLRAIGLSGRSFIPLLSSFACAVPGILATRSIEDRKERLITTMVAPLMTCSARLPVYTILIGAFIPEQTVIGFIGLQGLVMLGLYLFGLLVAAIAAFVMDRALRRAGKVPSILEMAPYRVPGCRSVGLRLWQRGTQFVRRAGTVILVMAVVVWALMTFPRPDGPVETPEARATAQENTAAGRIGKAIEPVIEPLGYDWRIGIGLLGSLAAREVFVSTMSVVYAVEDRGDEEETASRVAGAMGRSRWDGSDRPVYTLASVLSLLVFYALALQCVSTIGVVYKETRSVAWTAGQFVVLTVLAWVAAFVTYLLAS